MPNVLLKSLAGVTRRPIDALVRPRPRLNTALWNLQYALGLWRRLDAETNGSTALALIERHTPNPAILDLGCGTSANLPLDAYSYRSYLGVDISRKAIDKARRLGRPRTSFEVADIGTYRPAGRYDAILLREVLYYLPNAQVRELLGRLGSALTTRGRVIVQIWDIAGHRDLVRTVRDSGLVVHEEIAQLPADGPPGVILVLGAPAPAGEQ
jgi:SAM-dependent methyltransferase